MNRGYVKVWRKIQDNGILKNHRYCAFVLWSLTKASHKRINIIVGCQPVTLEGDVSDLVSRIEEGVSPVRLLRP